MRVSRRVLYRFLKFLSAIFIIAVILVVFIVTNLKPIVLNWARLNYPDLIVHVEKVKFRLPFRFVVEGIYLQHSEDLSAESAVTIAKLTLSADFDFPKKITIENLSVIHPEINIDNTKPESILPFSAFFVESPDEKMMEVIFKTINIKEAAVSILGPTYDLGAELNMSIKTGVKSSGGFDLSGSLIDLVASTTTVTTRPVQIDFESSLANYNSEDAESIWDTRFLVENIPVDARIGIEYVESGYMVTVDLNSGQKPVREFLELLTGIPERDALEIDAPSALMLKIEYDPREEYYIGITGQANILEGGIRSNVNGAGMDWVEAILPFEYHSSRTAYWWAVGHDMPGYDKGGITVKEMYYSRKDPSGMTKTVRVAGSNAVDVDDIDELNWEDITVTPDDGPQGAFRIGVEAEAKYDLELDGLFIKSYTANIRTDLDIGECVLLARDAADGLSVMTNPLDIEFGAVVDFSSLENIIEIAQMQLSLNGMQFAASGELESADSGRGFKSHVRHTSKSISDLHGIFQVPDLRAMDIEAPVEIEADVRYDASSGELIVEGSADIDASKASSKHYGITLEELGASVRFCLRNKESTCTWFAGTGLPCSETVVAFEQIILSPLLPLPYDRWPIYAKGLNFTKNGVQDEGFTVEKMRCMVQVYNLGGVSPEVSGLEQHNETTGGIGSYYYLDAAKLDFARLFEAWGQEKFRIEGIADGKIEVQLSGEFFRKFMVNLKIGEGVFEIKDVGKTLSGLTGNTEIVEQLKTKLEEPEYWDEFVKAMKHYPFTEATVDIWWGPEGDGTLYLKLLMQGKKVEDMKVFFSEVPINLTFHGINTVNDLVGLDDLIGETN